MLRTCARCVHFRFARAALAGALALAGSAFAQGEGPLVPRFEQVLERVLEADERVQRQFAEISLRALIAANRAEFSGARADGGAALTWQGGAAQYVARLERAYARLADYRVVAVIRERAGVVRLALDEEQVMLSAPRLSAQRALDAEIADAMCHLVDCTLPRSGVAERVARETRQIRREWVFSDRAPPVLSASDGLNCTFDDARHLRLKEHACSAVMQELRLLAEGLRAVAQHGDPLDWDSLAVEIGEDATVRVVHADGGAYFNLELRYLPQAPVIWREAVPWLQARLRGYAGYYMIRMPADLAYLDAP